MRSYRRDIDGLRAIAVVAVVLFHAGLTWVKGGFVGVDIFFVISGYLISTILLEDQAHQRYSIAGFYERRIRRILPALFVVLLVAIPFAVLTAMPRQLRLFGGGLASVVTFVSNIWFWKTTNYFVPAAGENPLLHTWSLSLEEQFYLIFPLLLAVVWPLGRRAMFWIFSALLVISLGAAQWGSVFAPTATFYLLPTRVWELLAGTLVALIHARPDAMTGISLRTRNLLSGAGLVLIAGSIFLYGGDLAYPSLYTAAPVLGAALLLYSEDNETTWVGRVLCLPPLVSCGLISYSLYLWHQPIFAFARLAVVDEPSPFLFVILTLLAIGLAIVTYRFVERPFRDRERISRKTVFCLAAAVGVLLLAVGGLIYHAKGLPSRLSRAERLESAVIAHEIKIRSAAIRTGECHYSDDEVPDLGKFLKQWYCVPVQDKALAGRVFVVGDSHAADIAMALRSAGMPIGQMTGAGCSVRWSNTSNRCRRLFKTMLEGSKPGPDDVIVLAQRWNRDDDLAGFHKDLDLWRSKGARVVLIGPKFEFPNLERRALSAARREGRQDLVHVPPASGLSKVQTLDFEREAKASGAPVVEIEDLFCALNRTTPCAPVDGDQYLVLDDTHFTVGTAVRLGPQILQRIQLAMAPKP